MKTKQPLNCFFLVCAIFASITAVSTAARETRKILPYQNATLPHQERVNDLLGRMILEEKIAQLQCGLKDPEKTDMLGQSGIGQLACVLRSYLPRAGADKANRIQKLALEKTRLKIPVIIHDEALHGILAKKGTSFPQAIGLAATWDIDLMAKVATAIGRETRSRGIRQVLSPVVNIARDVRWGRVEETYGEDPFLTSRLGVAFCQAIEREGVITTPKHYAANVGDGGRDSNAVHFSERLLREVYFPAFKACFQEGGAQSVMAAYNSLDGIPCSSSRWLLTDILRKEWCFQGYVVSDYGSAIGIYNMHHAAVDKKEAAKMAIEAGLDVELPEISIYGEPLLQAAREGLVPEAVINESVRRILAAKFRLGLFDSPFVDAKQAEKINDCPEHRQLALRSAREAIVLLKNQDNALPFRKTIRSIAVIGPAADAVRLGGYSGSGMKVVTLLEGIRNKLGPDAAVLYARGCEIQAAALPPIPAGNLLAGDGKEAIHGLTGEYFNNKELSGKPVLVRVDPQVNFDWGGDAPDAKMSPDQFSVRWTGKLRSPESTTYLLSITTDDGVRLWFDGKILLDNWYDRAPATDILSLRLEAGTEHALRIEYYENGGGAVAALGWNYSAAEGNKGIEEAVAAARQADMAVVAVGINEGEGRDRSRLELPGLQENLINAVAAAGKPFAVVLINGSAVTMANWIEKVPAVIEAWYPGEEGGNAVADVLFGDYNPAGRLPVTFPQSVGQVPLYHNFKPTGRGYDYADANGRPLFPFGHGLSFTRFDYANIQVTPETIHPADTVQVRVDVKNTGSRRGDEVVQLYLHAPVSNPIRPVKELKGFQRITLDPGETKTVSFALGFALLSHPGLDLQPAVETGKYEIWIGASSEDIRARRAFSVTKK